MTEYRFRLTGVPPDQAIKLIEVDPNISIADIKKSVQREYKLNPILAIQFIFKGKVLPDVTTVLLPLFSFSIKSLRLQISTISKSK